MKSFLLAKLLPAFALTLALNGVALAQEENPGSGIPSPLDPNAPPATAIPIDGGASLLLAGGVAYGLKKLRNRKRPA